MTRGWLQIVLLVVALIAVNLQCLARCADENCASQKKLPPCHRQKPQKHMETPCVQNPVADVRWSEYGDRLTPAIVLMPPGMVSFEFVQHELADAPSVRPSEADPPLYAVLRI